LIIESEVDADILNFRIAYWGLGQQIYHYRTIASDFPHREIIYAIAKQRGHDKPNNDDIKDFSQFLIAWHCLIAGWVIDSHYLVHHDVSPLLSKILPSLIGKLPAFTKNILDLQVAEEIIPGYQKVYETRKIERPSCAFEFDLQLAQALAYLPDKSWAKEQVYSSIKNIVRCHLLMGLVLWM
jgi:hypothetical protein